MPFGIKTKGLRKNIMVESAKNGNLIRNEYPVSIWRGKDIVSNDIVAEILSIIPENIQTKIKFALKQNTRVILAQTPETHELLDLAINLDKAKRRINEGSVINGNKTEAGAILVKFYNTKNSLANVIRDLCDTVNVEFKPPGNPVNSPCASDSKSIVEIMDSGNRAWKMEHLYRTVLGFMVLYETFQAAISCMPKDEQEFATKVLDDIIFALKEINDNI